VNNHSNKPSLKEEEKKISFCGCRSLFVYTFGWACRVFVLRLQLDKKNDVNAKKMLLHNKWPTLYSFQRGEDDARKQHATHRESISVQSLPIFFAFGRYINSIRFISFVGR
jgi:hypothetical protein